MLMTLLADAWWTSGQAGWIGGIGGTALGILGGLLGVVGGVFAPRGKGRAFVLSTMGVVVVVCLGILIVGVVSIILGQPYVVWYPCLLVGVVGSAVFGGLMPVVRNAYRQAEQRQLDARSLRGT